MSLEGKTVFVTGGTDGLGKATALLLARDGARVALHGRDRAKGDAAMKEIHAATGNARLELYLADFADLRQVRELAKAFQARHETLDVLVNNAGVGLFGGDSANERQVTRDGEELHFQVNYLAPFLLTHLLLTPLLKAAPSRIVNVASLGQAPIDFEDVMLERRYSGMQGYSQSKLAQIMFTIDLAERLRPSGVTVTALHPGTFMDTNMVRQSGFQPQSKVEDGAAAVFRLAASPEVEGETGTYYNQLGPGRANAQAYDADARYKLWELSLRLAKLQIAA